MGLVFIKCPNCKKELQFQAVPGWQQMLVECPVCHFKASASVYQSGSAAQGGQGADDDSTQVALPDCGAPCTEPGALRVEGQGGRLHHLRMGQNVVGRDCSTSTADIMLAPDRYMSRRHVRIDVVEGPAGVEHRLVDLGATNPVLLNGNPVHRGDIVVLQAGDKLHLGHTDVTFVEG